MKLLGQRFGYLDLGRMIVPGIMSIRVEEYN